MKSCAVGSLTTGESNDTWLVHTHPAVTIMCGARMGESNSTWHVHTHPAVTIMSGVTMGESNGTWHEHTHSAVTIMPGRREKLVQLVTSKTAKHAFACAPCLLCVPCTSSALDSQSLLASCCGLVSTQLSLTQRNDLS